MIFAVQGFERLDRELVGLRRQTVRDNVTINQLLPERIDSGRQLQMSRIEAGRDGVAVEEARRRQAASIAARAARQARSVRVPPERSCAVHRLETSPATTCIWTAAAT
jgi:hypothetical protein